MRPLKHLMNLFSTVVLFLSINQSALASIHNDRTDRMLDASTQTIDLRIDKDVVDRVKQGLYRLRNKIERAPLNQRKELLIESLSFDVSETELKGRLDSTIAIGEISVEEARIANRFISEFARTSRMANELSAEDVIPFLDQMIQETEQASIFAAAGTAWLLYAFVLLPAIALIAAIGTGICQLLGVRSCQ